MKGTRVMFIVNGTLDSHKAYTTNCLSLIKTARDAGYVTALSGLTRSDPSSTSELANDVLVVRKANLSILQLTLKTLWRLIHYRYDIIVIGSLHTWSFPIYSLFFKLVRPVRVVYYMQDPVPESYILSSNSPLKRAGYSLAVFCEMLMCAASDTILMPGEGYLETIRERTNLDGKQVLFAYNTWGLLKFLENRVSDDFRDAILEKYEMMDGFPIILYSGKIQPRIRGIETQLLIFSDLIKSYPGAVFVLTGDGDTAWIHDHARNLGVSNHVRVTGVISELELSAVYASSDLMILPPVDYLLPTKFFEGLLMGIVPIVWKQSKEMIEILGDAVITYDGTPQDLLRSLTHAIEKLDELRSRIAPLRADVIALHGTSRESFISALKE